jgi:hypothetical protein
MFAVHDFAALHEKWNRENRKNGVTKIKNSF